MPFILGMDTGKYGGWGLLDPNGRLLRVWTVPLVGKVVQWEEMLSKLKELHAWKSDISVVMEQPQVFARLEWEELKDGTKRPIATTMFGVQQLLENSGGMKALLAVAGFHPITYPSAKWKAAYRQRAPKRGSAKVPGESAGDRVVKANKVNKQMAVAIANSIWPDAQQKFGRRWTDGTAEAGLIAEYHRRILLTPKAPEPPASFTEESDEQDSASPEPHPTP
jgi:hypothetical protein